MNEFIMRVLEVVARYDMCGEVSWRADGEFAPVTFFVRCNDRFWWGTGDCERVTPENVEELAKACADAAAAGDRANCYGSDLFCARVRRMRPQGAAYPKEKELWPLFDACGPERPIDACNPRPHPSARTATKPQEA